MSLEKKLSQLKKVSELQPDKKYKAVSKFDLLAEISSQNRLMKANKLTFAEKFNLLSTRIVRRLIPSMSKVVAGFLIVVMGSSVSLVAQASVPGEPLWPVKRSIEKVELTLTLNSVKETEVHIKHVGKRLKEIDKILKEENGTPERKAKKSKAIKQVISHLEKDVSDVDNSLKIVKEERKPLEIVELAKKITDSVNETTKILEKQAVDSNDKGITEDLDEISKKNDEVKDSAVSVALEVHEEIVANKKVVEEGIVEDISTTEGILEMVTTTEAILEIVEEVSDEEALAVEVVVKGLIAEEIEETSGEIDVVKEKTEKVAETDITVKVKDEAGVALDEAKVFLEEGSLKNALDKVVESKEINDKDGEEIDEKIVIEEAEDNIVEEVVTEEVIEESEEPSLEDIEVKQVDAEIKEVEIKEVELELE